MSEFDDEWVTVREGISYLFGLYTDETANGPRGMVAADDEGLSPSDLDAYESGDWTYVVVVVMPVVAGEPVTACRVHATQIGWGTMPAETVPWQGGMHGRTVMDRESVETDPGAELIDDARAELVKFRAALNALPLD